MKEKELTVENVHPDLSENQRAEVLARIAAVYREVCGDGTP